MTRTKGEDNCSAEALQDARKDKYPVLGRKHKHDQAASHEKEGEDKAPFSIPCELADVCYGADK